MGVSILVISILCSHTNTLHRLKIVERAREVYLTVSPSKQLDPQIPRHRRPQHARDDLPLAKGEAVGIDGGALAGAAGNVVEGLRGHGLLGLLPQLVGVRRDGRLDAAEYALRVDLQLVLPVARRAAAIVPETHDFK
jgi:hypothetical protein